MLTSDGFRKLIERGPRRVNPEPLLEEPVFHHLAQPVNKDRQLESGLVKTDIVLCNLY